MWRRGNTGAAAGRYCADRALPRHGAFWNTCAWMAVVMGLGQAVRLGPRGDTRGW